MRNYIKYNKYHYKTMKFINLCIFHAVIAIVGILFLSSCNGEKLDTSLIDSITGKVSVEKITIDQEDFEMTEGENTVLTATVRASTTQTSITTRRVSRSI